MLKGSSFNRSEWDTNRFSHIAVWKLYPSKLGYLSGFIKLFPEIVHNAGHLLLKFLTIYTEAQWLSGSGRSTQPSVD
ncbi:hypothetical protein TNCV_2296611 [Trichonephila clavipes]|nr:hypothetical protein TNCV_2296611 [Trichonephila clavipes]